MRISQVTGSLFIIIFCSAMVSANVLQQIPIEQQFAQADLVVIGHIGARQQCLVENVEVACAEIIGDVVLKGRPTREGMRRLLILEAGYRELDINDMDLSGTHIMFMVRYRDEIYAPIIGRNSIFFVDRAR